MPEDVSQLTTMIFLMKTMGPWRLDLALRHPTIAGVHPSKRHRFRKKSLQVFVSIGFVFMFWMVSSRDPFTCVLCLMFITCLIMFGVGFRPLLHIKMASEKSPNSQQIALFGHVSSPCVCVTAGPYGISIRLKFFTMAMPAMQSGSEY